jgi:Homing endonuclease associated repeat
MTTTRIEKEAVISELQRVAKMLDTQHLGKKQYEKYGTIGRTTVINRFGSWNEAVRAAGLLPAVPQRRDILSEEDLLIDIINVTRKLKKVPSLSEIAAHGKYSRKPYERIWGSLAKSCEAAYAKYGLPAEIQEKASYEMKNPTKRVARTKSNEISSNAINNLKPHLLKISSAEVRGFVEEAINCAEAGLYRSAVIMSWVGAVSVLYDHVINYRLNDFNNEARRRDPKWKNAITQDDLALMKESEFLDILASLSMIGKNVKEQLKNNCLGLRNSCGHPNSLKIGRSTVESHIEILLLNVYEVF